MNGRGSAKKLNSGGGEGGPREIKFWGEGASPISEDPPPSFLNEIALSRHVFTTHVSDVTGVILTASLYLPDSEPGRPGSVRALNGQAQSAWSEPSLGNIYPAWARTNPAWGVYGICMGNVPWGHLLMSWADPGPTRLGIDWATHKILGPTGSSKFCQTDDRSHRFDYP